MKTYVEEIKDYCPFNELEKTDREMMEHIISVYGDKALYRDNLAHFTASSMILNKDRTRVLMVYHTGKYPILNKENEDIWMGKSIP